MLNTRERGLIALVSGALLQKRVELPEDFSMASLLSMAKRHQIATIIVEALAFHESLDVSNCIDRLLQISGLSISITETQMQETQTLCAAFEEEKIDYALLKGAVVKDYYPKKYLRTMADVDILIRDDQYERILPIMKRLGYTQEIESDHEYNWRKGHVHMELHKYLIPSYNKRYFAFFGDGWDRMHPVREGSTEYAMSDEDQFLYTFTHYAKHFRDGGIGIKHLMDLWVCKKACQQMDEAYILKSLKKMDLDEFYTNVMQTIAVWFDGAELTPITKLITREIISGGAYGKEEAHKKSEIVRVSKTSKFRWTMRMIFLPYKNMCMKYPFLRYLPFLLPIMWVVRWITALFFKPNDTKKNVQVVRNMSQKSVDHYREYLDSIGLHFEKE